MLAKCKQISANMTNVKPLLSHYTAHHQRNSDALTEASQE